jgi:uncharacterized membrane protein YfcA
MPDPSLTYLLLCLSAFAAGVVNAVAGGGTLLTFPVLLWALSDKGTAAEVLANATSTVALVPGSLAGAWGYRHDLRGTGPWLRLLILPSLLGGLAGSLLLIRLPGSVFHVLIPWLLLTAALLFMAQPSLSRFLEIGDKGHLPTAGLCALLVLFQFGVSVYGGYFGAGIGILMLTALSLMGVGDIHRMNAVKTFLAAGINGVSVGVFVAYNQVEWRPALAMAVAAILGGYFGARVGRRLPRALIRWLVIVIGLGLAAHYFLKSAGVSG